MATPRTGLLGDPRWERWAAYGGVVFVVLAVLWAVFISDSPNPDSSDAAITSWFDDDGNRTKLWLGFVSLTVAGLFFLWFLGSLRTLLRRAEGDPGRLSALAFGGGVAFVALLFVKNAVRTTIAAAIAFSDDRFELSADAHRIADAFFALLLGQEGVAAAAMIGFASIVVLRTAVLPRWLGWAGVGVAVLSLFTLALFGLPLILVLAWVLAVSLLMLRTASLERTAPET